MRERKRERRGSKRERDRWGEWVRELGRLKEREREREKGE